MAADEKKFAKERGWTQGCFGHLYVIHPKKGKKITKWAPRTRTQVLCLFTLANTTRLTDNDISISEVLYIL